MAIFHSLEMLFKHSVPFIKQASRLFSDIFALPVKESFRICTANCASWGASAVPVFHLQRDAEIWILINEGFFFFSNYQNTEPTKLGTAVWLKWRLRMRFSFTEIPLLFHFTLNLSHNIKLGVINITDRLRTSCTCWHRVAIKGGAHEKQFNECTACISD